MIGRLERVSMLFVCGWCDEDHGNDVRESWGYLDDEKKGQKPRQNKKENGLLVNDWKKEGRKQFDD